MFGRLWERRRRTPLPPISPRPPRTRVRQIGRIADVGSRRLPPRAARGEDQGRAESISPLPPILSPVADASSPHRQDGRCGQPQAAPHMTRNEAQRRAEPFPPLPLTLQRTPSGCITPAQTPLPPPFRASPARGCDRSGHPRCAARTVNAAAAPPPAVPARGSTACRRRPRTW